MRFLGVLMAFAILMGTGCAVRVVPTASYITAHGQFKYVGTQQHVYEAAKRALVVEGYSLAMSDAENFTIVTRPKLIDISVQRTSRTASTSAFAIRLSVVVIDGHRSATVRVTPAAFVAGVRQSDYEFKDSWLRHLLNTILRTIWDQNKKR